MSLVDPFKFNNTITNNNVGLADALTEELQTPIQPSLLTALVNFLSSQGLRPVLTQDRTYYVRTDGSDSNDGLTNTPQGAFLTIQKAVTTAYTLDFSIYNVTIQLGIPGTYAGNILVMSPIVGNGILSLRGDTSNPTAYKLAFTSGLQAFLISNYATLYISGVQISNSGTNGGGVFVTRFGTLVIDGLIDFGACPNRYHLEVNGPGYINIISNYSISGNAVFHYSTSSLGEILISAGIGPTLNITLIGTRVFTTFASCTAANLTVFNTTYTLGTTTGQTYNVTGNGVVNTFGAAVPLFPGTVAGVTSTGGQYL